MPIRVAYNFARAGRPSREIIRATGSEADGAFGAVLSTLNYFAQRRRDRRALKVEIDDPGDKTFFSPALSPVLHVSAINIGYRSIHLEYVAIVPKDGEEIIIWAAGPSITDLVRELKEGKKFTADITVNSLSALLAKKGYKDRVKLRGQIVDTAGNIYPGPWCGYRIRTLKPKPDPEAVKYTIRM